MAIALVLGGAKCVHEDIAAAEKLFKADIIVAVKDIGITWPHVDHWATYHPERLPKELAERRRAGLPDPGRIWSHITPKKSGINLPITALQVRGGSSGFLGVHVALLHATRVVICGIPLDPAQVHYKRPKKGGWPPAKAYRMAWTEALPKFKDRVRSMSGWTRQVLGAPDAEWLKDPVYEQVANPPAA